MKDQTKVRPHHTRTSANVNSKKNKEDICNQSGEEASVKPINALQSIISGRRIENQGMLDLNASKYEADSGINPRVVFASRSRSKSTDNCGKKQAQTKRTTRDFKLNAPCQMPSKSSSREAPRKSHQELIQKPTKPIQKESKKAEEKFEFVNEREYDDSRNLPVKATSRLKNQNQNQNQNKTKARPKTSLKKRENLNKSAINCTDQSFIKNDRVKDYNKNQDMPFTPMPNVRNMANKETKVKKEEVSFRDNSFVAPKPKPGIKNVNTNDLPVNKSAIDLVKAYKGERERSDSTRTVDRIVKENLRKLKEKKEAERQEKIEKEEKMKMNKEQLIEHNKEIRQMNSKSTKSIRPPSQESKVHKYAWGVDQQKLMGEQSKRDNVTESFMSHRHVATDRERLAKLGLEFVQQVGSKKKDKENVEANKPDDGKKIKVSINLNIPGKVEKVEMPEELEEPAEQMGPIEKEKDPKKEAIINYMVQKKERIIKEIKEKKTTKEKKKEQIDNNISKLEQFVQKAFSSNKSKVLLPIKQKKKKKSKTKGKKGKKKNTNYTMIEEKKPIEEDKVQDGAAMNIIKQQLLEEIEQNDSNVKEEEKKNRPVISQTTERLLEQVTTLSKNLENIKLASKKQETNHMAKKIQACFRGHQARNIYKEIKKDKEKQMEIKKQLKEKEQNKEQKKEQKFDEMKEVKNNEKQDKYVNKEVNTENVYVEPAKEKKPEKEKQKIESEQSKNVSDSSFQQEINLPQAIAFEESEYTEEPSMAKQREENVDTSNADLMSMDKEGEETDFKLLEEKKLQAKLLREIQYVENQMQNIDIQDRERKKLIHYLDKDASKIADENKQGRSKIAVSADYGYMHKSKFKNDSFDAYHDQKHSDKKKIPPLKQNKSSLAKQDNDSSLNDSVNMFDEPSITEEVKENPTSKSKVNSNINSNVNSKSVQYNEKMPYKEEYKLETEKNTDQNDSLEAIMESEETPQKSIFEKNAFHEFTLRKFKDMMKEDNLTRIISMREKLLLFREKTEKKYIQKMYKTKKYSPRTYHRKKNELEKWITKEKVEIKKSKRQFIENWKRTADMIEETHLNAQRLKKMVFENTLSCASDTHSTISIALNSSRIDTERAREREQEEKRKNAKRKYVSQSVQKAGKLEKHIFSPVPASDNKILSKGSDDDLDFYLNDSGNEAEKSRDELSAKKPTPNKKQELILIKENEFPKETEKSKCKGKAEEIKEFVAENEIPIKPIISNEEKLIVKEEPRNVETVKALPRQNIKAEVVPVVSTVSIVPIVEAISITPEKKQVEKAKSNEAEISKQERRIAAVQNITEAILKQIVEQETQLMFPVRESNKKTEVSEYENVVAILPISRETPEEKKIPDAKAVITVNSERADKIERAGASSNTETLLLQSLAFGTNKGIEISPDYINYFLGLLFDDAINKAKEVFLNEINSPIHIDPLKLLKALQNEDSSEIEQIQYWNNQTTNQIIPQSSYDKISRSLVVTGEDDNFIEECQETYNKALYSAANEGLNLLRPYGILGEPMIWSNQQRIVFKSICDTGLIAKNVKNMVIDWTSFEAGPLPKPEYVNNNKFDEDLFNEVRDKRLATLIAQEVLDNEEAWLNYEAENTEVKIDVADMILEQLVVETAELLNKIDAKKRNDR